MEFTSHLHHSPRSNPSNAKHKGMEGHSMSQHKACNAQCSARSNPTSSVQINSTRPAAAKVHIDKTRPLPQFSRVVQHHMPRKRSTFREIWHPKQPRNSQQTNWSRSRSLKIVFSCFFKLEPMTQNFTQNSIPATKSKRRKTSQSNIMRKHVWNAFRTRLTANVTTFCSCYDFVTRQCRNVLWMLRMAHNMLDWKPNSSIHCTCHTKHRKTHIKEDRTSTKFRACRVKRIPSALKLTLPTRGISPPQPTLTGAFQRLRTANATGTKHSSAPTRLSINKNPWRTHPGKNRKVLSIESHAKELVLLFQCFYFLIFGTHFLLQKHHSFKRMRSRCAQFSHKSNSDIIHI